MKPHLPSSAFTAAFLGLLIACSAAIAQPATISTLPAPKQAVSPKHPLPLIYTVSNYASFTFRGGERYWAVTAEARRDKTGPLAPWALFKTLASPELRQWASQLPEGSIVVMQISVGGSSQSPAQLAFWAEVNDFTKFCQANKLEVDISGAIF